jgi:uncharacterized protein YqcC (DUF446 family)
MFTYFRHSERQQQAIWSQEPMAVEKQSKLPSFLWIFLIKSLLEYFQVSLIPKAFAFFSISTSFISASFQ